MQLLCKVRSNYGAGSDSHEKGWRDGQIIDIRPDGFFAGDKERKHHCVIDLPSIDYWQLRGSLDWKSTDASVLNLKKYLCVADNAGKYAWDYANPINNYIPIERKRDRFVDFRWLLDSGYISQEQYDSIYNKDIDHLDISLPFTDLEEFLKHEDSDTRLDPSKDEPPGSISEGTYQIGTGAGADYSTVASFEADIAATLTGNLTGEHMNEETAISAAVIFDMNTSSYKFTLTAQAGAEHNGSYYGNGARINYGTSDRIELDEITNNTLINYEISKLAIDASGSTNFAIYIEGVGGNGIINRMLLKGDSASNDAVYILNGYHGNLRISNNIVYGFSNTSNKSGGITLNASTTTTGDNLYVYNNTSIKNYYGIQVYAKGAGCVAVAKNNLLQGNAQDFYGTWDTTSKNVSEDASSPDDDYDNLNCHDGNSCFQDYTNNDHRLAATGDEITTLDDGDDLSGTFTDDVVGTTRSTWYIGAYELVEASSSSSSSFSSSSSSSSQSVSFSSSSSSESVSFSSSSSSGSISQSSSSESVSFSSSSSSSVSGTQNYSRETATSLKTNDAQLTTLFGAEDYVTVATDDGQYVDQNLTATYATFLFKDQNGSQTQFTVLWNGQCALAPSLSTAYLQVYNRTTEAWETLDSNNTEAADVDFSLTGQITSNLENYFNVDGWVACRVYQQNI